MLSSVYLYIYKDRCEYIDIKEKWLSGSDMMAFCFYWSCEVNGAG